MAAKKVAKKTTKARKPTAEERSERAKRIASIYVPPEDVAAWQKLAKVAKSLGTSRSAIVLELVSKYVAKH